MTAKKRVSAKEKARPVKSAEKLPGRPELVPPLEARKTKVSVREKIQELLNPLRYDLGYPISYLYMWYESYQQIMRWIGAVAAGMLTFTGGFLLSDLVTGTPGGALSVPTDPTSIKVSVALFDPLFLQVSLILLAISVLFVLLALISTYNWLVAGIKAAYAPLEEGLLEAGLIEDLLAREFRSYGAVFSLRGWGMVSFVTGGVAGIALLLGVLFYTISAWGVIATL